MSSDFCIRCDNALSVYCGQCVDAIRKELDESREAHKKAEEEIKWLRGKHGLALHLLDKAKSDLHWANEMACENTPHPACCCPGCETARDRARRGVAGPEDE